MILDASLIVSWQDVTLWIKQCLALLQRVVWEMILQKKDS
jgi:hypothetical protein